MTLEEWVDETPQGSYAREQYKELLHNQRFLECLQGAGVDNWEGFDIAHELMESE